MLCRYSIDGWPMALAVGDTVRRRSDWWVSTLRPARRFEPSRRHDFKGFRLRHAFELVNRGLTDCCNGEPVFERNSLLAAMWMSFLTRLPCLSRRLGVLAIQVPRNAGRTIFFGKILPLTVDRVILSSGEAGRVRERKRYALRWCGGDVMSNCPSQLCARFIPRRAVAVGGHMRACGAAQS